MCFECNKEISSIKVSFTLDLLDIHLQIEVSLSNMSVLLL